MANKDICEDIYIGEMPGPTLSVNYAEQTITITVPDVAYFQRSMKVVLKDGSRASIGEAVIEELGELVKYRLQEFKDGRRHTTMEPLS